MSDGFDHKRRATGRNSAGARFIRPCGESNRRPVHRKETNPPPRRRSSRDPWHPVLLLFIPAALALAAPADEAPDPPVNPAYRRPDFSLFHSGRYTYERHCMICHGMEGDGKGELSASLPVKPRSFRQGVFKYRSTPPGKLPTDVDLRRTVRGGISGTAMGMFSMLTEQEIAAVTEYLKFFSRRWRKPENFAPALSFPDPPEWLRSRRASAQHAERGRVLYNSSCVSCHGPKGDGKGIVAGQLKDLWGFDVTPADLRQPHLRCGDDLKDVYRTLTTGLDGTPMVSFAEVFTPAQRWDIVAYVKALRDGTAAGP